jgi:hypothetical protein
MGTWAESNTFLFADAIELDWEASKAMFDDSNGTNECMLVALPWRAISTIVSTLRFAEYWALWGLPADKAAWTVTQQQRWYEISAFIAEMEACLMSGCSVQDLIGTQRMLIAAIIGQEIDLADPMPTTADFTETGISPRLRALTTAMGGDDENIGTIATALEAIALIAAA